MKALLLILFVAIAAGQAAPPLFRWDPSAIQGPRVEGFLSAGTQQVHFFAAKLPMKFEAKDINLFAVVAAAELVDHDQTCQVFKSAMPPKNHPGAFTLKPGEVAIFGAVEIPAQKFDWIAVSSSGTQPLFHDCLWRDGTKLRLLPDTERGSDSTVRELALSPTSKFNLKVISERGRLTWFVD